MATLYHAAGSCSRDNTGLTGEIYEGSFRLWISSVFQGEVGFAYGYLPDSWTNPDGSGRRGIYEIEIPDDTIVLAGIEDMIPRRPEPRDIDGLRVRADDACALIPARDAWRYGFEICFHADGSIRFGKEAPNRTEQNRPPVYPDVILNPKRVSRGDYRGMFGL